jgi:hypothetical protein
MSTVIELVRSEQQQVFFKRGFNTVSMPKEAWRPKNLVKGDSSLRAERP